MNDISFTEALGIVPGITAIIGGGGKTSLMNRLAAELSAAGSRVIICTSTHIWRPADLQGLENAADELSQWQEIQTAAESIPQDAKAGELLGVRPVELADIPAEGGIGGGGITFAPQITIQGSADRSVIDEALAEAQARFEAWYLQMQRRNARTAY